MNLTQILKCDLEASGRCYDFKQALACRLRKNIKTIEAKIANTHERDFTLNQLPEVCDVAQSLKINLKTFRGILMSLLAKDSIPRPIGESLLAAVAKLGEVAALCQKIKTKPNQRETYLLLQLCSELENTASALRAEVKRLA